MSQTNTTNLAALSIEDAVAALCERHGVTLGTVTELGPGGTLLRGGRNSMARLRLSMWLELRDVTVGGLPKWSYQTIAAAFGTAHTTVVTAVKRHIRQSPAAAGTEAA